jgi:peptide/bleomycin uptake transporter
VIFWQAGGGDWLLRLTGASQNVAISAARFWSLNYLVFYAYYVFCVGVFALFGLPTAHTAGNTGQFSAPL